MSRQEDFQAQAKTYANKCGGTTQEKCAIMADYVEGAKYGYQYAIKKTIEFLKEKEFGDWIEQEATSFVEDFRKAMEE